MREGRMDRHRFDAVVGDGRSTFSAPPEKSPKSERHAASAS